MGFLQKIKTALMNFMRGRHGLDHLGMFTLIAGLVLSIAGTWIPFVSLLGTALYIITLFRMFSRNEQARRQENQKYLSLTSGWTTKIRQFFRRCKNRKEYRYFKCPQCKVLLRSKKGGGEKTIHCAKCGHDFTKKV